jgi:hypothetical protein
MYVIQERRRRLDYDAYMKGRRAGKYVVIYLDDIPPETEDVAPVADSIITIGESAIAEIVTDRTDEISEPVYYATDSKQNNFKTVDEGFFIGIATSYVQANRYRFIGVITGYPNCRGGPYID